MEVPLLTFPKPRVYRKLKRFPPPPRAPRPVFDIGEGPWYYAGYRASLPEMRILLVLEEMGFTPKFQQAVIGGRRLRGGQVLDIVVDEIYPTVVIDVRGYYHKGAAAKHEDDIKVMMVKALDPNIRYVVIWEEETERKDQLEAKLEYLVGRYGRRTRA